MQQHIEEHKVDLERGKLLAKELTNLYLNQNVIYDVTMKSYKFISGEEYNMRNYERKEPSIIAEIYDMCRDRGVKVLVHEPGHGHLADFKVGRINVYLSRLKNEDQLNSDTEKIYRVDSIGVEGDTVHMG